MELVLGVLRGGSFVRRLMLAVGALSLFAGVMVAAPILASADPVPAADLDGVMAVARSGWADDSGFGALARPANESIVQLQDENREYWQQHWTFEAVDAAAGVYRIRNRADAADGVGFYLSRAGDPNDQTQPGSGLYLARHRQQSAQLWTVTVEDMGGWERYQLVSGWDSATGTLTVPGVKHSDNSWSRGGAISLMTDTGLSSQRWTLDVLNGDPGPTEPPPPTNPPPTEPPPTEPPPTNPPPTEPPPTNPPPVEPPPEGRLPTASIPAWHQDLTKETKLRGALTEPLLGDARYINCDTGNDGSTGTSAATAWRSLAKASGLPTGTDLQLSGTCSGQQLVVNWAGTPTDPVVVKGSGTGTGRPVLTANGNEVAANAIIQIARPHVEVWDVIVDGEPVESRSSPKACHLDNSSTSYEFGFLRGISIEADDTLVARVDVSGAYAGVYIGDGRQRNVVAHSVVHDNQIMTTGATSDDDAGAMGVLIWGDNNEVAWNYFSGHRACSPDYGVDGASVEIFNGSGNNIHNNMAHQDHVFTELGEGRGQSANNTFDYNTFGSDISLPTVTINGNRKQMHDSFLITRWGGEAFGRIEGTTVRNNLVYALGEPGDGVICGQCVPAALSAGGNEFHVTRHEWALFNGSSNSGSYGSVAPLPGSPGADGALGGN